MGSTSSQDPLAAAEHAAGPQVVISAHEFLLQCGDPRNGESFFHSLARYLSNTLDMDYVCISRVVPGQPQAETLAVFDSGRFENNTHYTLHGTPCGELVGRQICCIPEGVQSRFPNDSALKELQAESYLGVTLWSTANQPIGLIAVIGRTPLKHWQAHEAVLRLAALRAAAELERIDAEQQLRESERRLAIAFDCAAIGMALVSPDGGFRKVNHAFCKMLGYTAEELLSGTFQQITHPDDLEQDLDFVRRMLADEIQTYQMEKRYLHKAGHCIWAMLHVSLARGPNGEPQYFTSQIKDITARKQAEQQKALTTEVLTILNQMEDVPDVTTHLLETIQRSLGVEAAAIRLAGEGRDFHYVAHIGFSDEFIQLENELCPYRDAPDAPRDAEGNLLYECTCGLVATGRTNPSNPLFTKRGSSWTNDALPFLHVPAIEDPRFQPRNRCIHAGYRSVALIPIRTGGRIIGLLQLNDRQPNKFTLEQIEFLESLVGSVAIALRRQQTHAELQHTLRRLELTLEATNAGVWDWDLPSGRIIWSQALYKLYGVDPAQVSPSFAAWKQSVHPDDREPVAALVTQMAAAGAEIDVEWRVNLPGDQVRWLMSRGRPIKNDAGRVDSYMGMVVDITQIKLAEERLRASESNLQSWFSSIHESLALFDRHCTVLAANATFLERMRLKHEDCIGRNIFELLPPEVAARRRPWVQQVLDSGQAATFEDERNGLWMHHTMCPVLDERGEVVRLAIYATDITAVKQAEHEREQTRSHLMQAQKMESIGRLAGGVAHDFNNMLSVIMGYSELSLTRLKPDQPLYGELTEINQAARRSAELTRQLLAFARKQDVSPRTVDLNLAVASMLKMLGRLIGEHIELHWEPAPTVWPVRIDPAQLDQILANLCVNARDAIGASGAVTLATRNVTLGKAAWSHGISQTPGEHVLLTVADSGCGMTEEMRAQIFEPFFTTKPQGQGTGLGLATVYGIVKQNGGTIEVESTPGKGTCFLIYLPRDVNGDDPTGSADEQAALTRGSGTILLVEDESTILHIGKAMLEKMGYRVLIAASAEQAQRIAGSADETIDLLVTDVVMPQTNGRELYERLRAQRPGLRCLFMSGYTADVIASNGILDEGVVFLQKPFRQSDLAAKVRQALSAHVSD